MSMADLSIGAPPPPEVGQAPDPDTEPGAAIPGDWDTPLEEVPEADPAAIRAIIELIGESMHAVGTVLPTGRLPLLEYVATDELVPDHWKFTEAELDALVPPVTRIVNARPALRRAAQQGDHVIIAKTIFGWGSSNIIAGVAARQVRAMTTEDWERNDHQQREAGSPSGTVDRSAAGPVHGPDAGEVRAHGPVGVGIFPPAD